jgi:hypothetical protein
MELAPPTVLSVTRMTDLWQGNTALPEGFTTSSSSKQMTDI